MALGKKIFEIDFTHFVKGMSTSDDISDGGFSPNTDAVNLIADPGILYEPGQPTDKSTNVVGSIIASSEDPAGTLTRVFVDDEGHYYTWNATTMTLARTDATNPSGYIQGKTDMNAFDGSVFATTSTTVVKWTVDTTFTDNFITGLNSLVPHPLLTFEGYQYIGDGNVLKRMTNATDNTPDSILTLSTNQNIVALGIDPGSGKMLISTIQGFSLSLTSSNTNKVLFYDGFSNKALRVVPVDSTVTAFPFTEGQLYCAYGQNLGLWNGAGITFLRKFEVTFLFTQLFYKQHFTSIGPTLYFIENTRIVAHGPVRQGGDKVFYPAYKNQVNSNALTHIANLGAVSTTQSILLSIGFATDKFYTWDTTAISTSNTQNFLSNVIDFDNEYWLRWIRIIWKTQVTSNVDPGSLRLRDQDGIVNSINPTLSGLVDLKNVSGAASAFKDLNNINAKLKQVQVEMILDTVNPGIRRIIGYGEIADKPN